MNGTDLFEAIGNIDERYLAELETSNRVVKFPSKKFLSAACIVVLLLSSGTIYQVTRTPSISNHSPMSESDTSDQGVALTNVRVGENGITEYEIGIDTDYVHITYEENDYYLIERISTLDVSEDFCTEFILIEEVVQGENEPIITSEDTNLYREIYYDAANDRIIIYEATDSEPATYLICSPY